tara:strand:+ start:1035 stop:1169 length:135 start_codon:yes stop_codon:yes gene_type:complete
MRKIKDLKTGKKIIVSDNFPKSKRGGTCLHSNAHFVKKDFKKSK